MVPLGSWIGWEPGLVEQPRQRHGLTPTVETRRHRVPFMLLPLHLQELGLAHLPHLGLLEGGLSEAALRQLLQRWGYGVIFVGMLLENAGLPLPGETLTLLGGYAAGSGQLQLGGVIAAAASGAVLGDNLGYWVGRRAGWGLILRVGGLLRRSPDQMDSLRLQFLRHATASVLLGRFVAVLRVLAGPMAGAVGMAWPRFFIANCAGALLWAGSMVSLAWLGGRWLPFERMVKSVLEFGLGALLLVCLSLLLPRLIEFLQGRWPGAKRRAADPTPLAISPLPGPAALGDARLP
ncbi:MAG: DedA family protein [Synechococcaceae cyanobacterium]|jgi:membrane protein DedA with SNARE-associated domain